MNFEQEDLSEGYLLLTKIHELRTQLPAPTRRKRLQHLRKNVRRPLNCSTRTQLCAHFRQARFHLIASARRIQQLANLAFHRLRREIVLYQFAYNTPSRDQIHHAEKRGPDHAPK